MTERLYENFKTVLCIFLDIQVQSFRQFPYMAIPFPYKEMTETLNLIFSKTTHRNSIRF